MGGYGVKEMGTLNNTVCMCECVVQLKLISQVNSKNQQETNQCLKKGLQQKKAI